MKADAAAIGSIDLTTRFLDFATLTKPGITVMVVMTTALGYLLAGGDLLSPHFFWALIGTAFVSAGGSALNHVLERRTDALMTRTAGRPVASGRMRAEVGVAFGVGLSVVGLAILWLRVNALTTVLGAVALLGYAFIYTPLKRKTSLSTLVGAVPGAIPPVMGWTAVQAAVEPGAWALFGILFLWQLPHFLAIAWLCRRDYAAAGFPMLPVLHPDGQSTARQALLYCAALVPVSLAPTFLGLAGPLYLGGALLLGAAFLATCVAFLRSYSNPAAKRILLASVIYLPAVLGVLALDRLI